MPSSKQKESIEIGIVAGALLCVTLSVIVVRRNIIIDTTKWNLHGISSVSQILVSWSALALGFYYFVKKNSIEKHNDEKERRRKGAQTLQSLLEQYDVHASSILNQAPQNEKELNVLRSKFYDAFTEIDNFVAGSAEFLELSQETIGDIVNMHRLLENETIFRAAEFIEYSKHNFASMKAKFKERQLGVKRACIEIINN